MSSPEPRHSSRGETRVFLENLPKDVRKDEIDKEFSVYGRIAKVYLIYDPPGSGFVEYFDSGDAEFAASSMDGSDFLGSKLKTQLTRGGVPRGRASIRRPFISRGRGFSSYDDRDGGGYSMGRGMRGGGGGGFRGSRGGGGSSFESRGRSRRGSSFGSSRGFGGPRGFSGGGGFSRGGGGRSSYSRRGEGGPSRGFSGGFNNGGGYRGGRYEEDDDDDELDQNGYQKMEKYQKYDRFERDSGYDKPDSGYLKYSSGGKFSSYGGGSGGRKESYRRSRSPLDFSPDDYHHSASPYQRNRSRSPVGRPVRAYSSRNFEDNLKSLSPGQMDEFRRPRSKSSRNYSSDHAGEPSSSSHSYGRKEYVSSSYGNRRSSMDERY